MPDGSRMPDVLHGPVCDIDSRAVVKPVELTTDETVPEAKAGGVLERTKAVLEKSDKGRKPPLRLTDWASI